MTTKKPKVSDNLKLPEGVSLREWSLERARWQNPRIRAFLGCIRVVDEVFESNYAILHCSPKRLAQIWEQVRKIAVILRQEVAPLLAAPSMIPELEEARESATVYLETLERNLLGQIDRLPETVDEGIEEQVRKLLCVAIGQLHAFLLDTLGEMLARDPRSHSDVDYFLTRKFARDVDESEWLHTSVSRLEDFLSELNRTHTPRVTAIGSRMAAERRIPFADEWEEIAAYLQQLDKELVPRLKMVLGLRGIRLSELELLDGHASRLPAMSRTLFELHDAGTRAHQHMIDLERSQAPAATDSPPVRVMAEVFCDRIVSLMRQVHDHVRDLTTYLPVWRQCIEQRRAMMLRHSKPS